MRTTLTAVIVDDEPQSIRLLKNLLEQYCPAVDMIGSAGNVEDAWTLIRTVSPALVFLDVEMPDGSGFQLLRKFSPVPFRVIFTTAYDRYAISAIRASAVDYLLKPISIPELREAVEKAITTAELLQPAQVDALAAGIRNTQLPGKISLPTQEGIRFVTIEEILYCESSNNYTYFFLKDKSKLLVARTLKEYDELLSPHHFFRVHQSFLVNLRYIQKYIRGRGGYIIMENHTEIPVSVRKKDEFLSLTNLG